MIDKEKYVLLLLRHGECGISSKAKDELQSTYVDEYSGCMLYLILGPMVYILGTRTPSTIVVENDGLFCFVLHALLSGFFTKHPAPFVKIYNRTRIHKR